MQTTRRLSSTSTAAMLLAAAAAVGMAAIPYGMNSPLSRPSRRRTSSNDRYERQTTSYVTTDQRSANEAVRQKALEQAAWNQKVDQKRAGRKALNANTEHMVLLGKSLDEFETLTQLLDSSIPPTSTKPCNHEHS